MISDRYLRIILTVIAIELLWLGLKDLAPAVAAQPQRQPPAQMEPAPVIITGIRLDERYRDALPMSVVGNLTVGLAPRTLVRIEAERPLKVEADKPLPVQQVDYTPGLRPGE